MSTQSVEHYIQYFNTMFSVASVALREAEGKRLFGMGAVLHNDKTYMYKIIKINRNAGVGCIVLDSHIGMHFTNNTIKAIVFCREPKIAAPTIFCSVYDKIRFQHNIPVHADSEFANDFRNMVIPEIDFNPDSTEAEASEFDFMLQTGYDATYLRLYKMFLKFIIEHQKYKIHFLWG